MGPGIIIPVVALLVVVPLVATWARRRFKESLGEAGDDPVIAPSVRLTSKALRELPVPQWRVVYEIAPDRLGGVEHVVVGPPGVFALQTSMDPLPDPPAGEPDAQAVARSAIARGDLDDALARCAMASDRLVLVHWGANEPGRGPAVDTLPGTTAVDGRALADWFESLGDAALTSDQVDLAWQTVVTSIGRPDPLA